MRWRCWEQFLTLCLCQLRMNMIKYVRKCLDPERPPSISVFLLSRTEIRYSNGVKMERSQQLQQLQHRYASIFTVATQSNPRCTAGIIMPLLLWLPPQLICASEALLFRCDCGTAVGMFACLCECSAYLWTCRKSQKPLMKLMNPRDS